MKNKDWFKKSSVYQIYPKSFKDSNNDGIGDIKGIIEKLDYIKNLGIDVIWLTPIYVSPQKDNGYDISDYYNIDPIFGSMDDFEELLSQVHNRDMKLIMDMVINHTSTEHMWFKEAQKGEDNPYHDFYIWKKTEDGKLPNNWKSKFGGSAWQYVKNLDKYYLHLFDVSQADLNWENPKLREEIYKMMNYWMNKGVDGFRLDVINLLSKNQDFPNDTLESPNHDGRRFYTDGPRIHEYLKNINKNVFSLYENSMTVGEMSSTTINHCINYTKPENMELDMTFNFHHLKVDYPNGEKWALGEFDFEKLKDILFDWQVKMQDGNGWNATFWCNHDQPRVLSRFGDDKNYPIESAKMLGTAIHLMRGTPYVYQGEEIGMTNPKFDNISGYKDVESINAYNNLIKKGYREDEVLDILKSKSRDNSRTPIQWNENGGFTKGTSWINMASNYKTINAKDAVENEESIYNYYKKLINLRKEYDIISHGTIKPILKEHKNVLGYIREYEGQKLLVLCNFFGEKTEVDISEYIKSFEGKILITNYSKQKLDKSMILKPYECFAVLFE
ncbi:alpha,alpha-phosphotrehalase [Paraclostridium ghonii]|uniref:alpha,alpha-phosphotrehalase n=1 Tax=Paraclostridium ghonii TaxID=29358 RepID=UPI00202CACB8|nr:alpha,alpha-phosphotrehalase [Paeniclostridium ghonii]MCM0167843.1 alpha,alpha-phosphotrehalase [Paeniclostridium ghonii]